MIETMLNPKKTITKATMDRTFHFSVGADCSAGTGDGADAVM
jgi:hypothetical protein